MRSVVRVSFVLRATVYLSRQLGRWAETEDAITIERQSNHRPQSCASSPSSLQLYNFNLKLFSPSRQLIIPTSRRLVPPLQSSECLSSGPTPSLSPSPSAFDVSPASLPILLPSCCPKARPAILLNHLSRAI